MIYFLIRNFDRHLPSTRISELQKFGDQNCKILIRNSDLHLPEPFSTEGANFGAAVFWTRVRLVHADTQGGCTVLLLVQIMFLIMLAKTVIPRSPIVEV